MMKKMAPLLAFVLMLCLFGCSKGVSGIYVHDQHKSDYLELRSDSTFFLRVDEMGLSGKYRVDGEIITLTVNNGPSVQMNIHAGVLTAPQGQTWSKGERPAGAAAANNFELEGARRANEAAAASRVRTINTSEVTYTVTYPAAGYAHNLSSLGPGGTNCASPTPDHACLVDQELGCASSWCVKNGYRFAIVSSSRETPFADYTVTATPVDANSGRKSFCANPDSIIRWQTGPPLGNPLTQEECSRWPPVM